MSATPALGIRPTFKATAPKAVWCPGKYTPYSHKEKVENYNPSSQENVYKPGPPVAAPKTTVQETLPPPASPPGSIEDDCSLSPSLLYPDLDSPPQPASPLPPPLVAAPSVEAPTKDSPTFRNEKFIAIGAPEDPVPPNAQVVDRKVVIEGDKIHTDTYYAIPIKQTTTTITTRPAEPTKYEGIGPTEQGIPVGLRTGVKDEHASDWYKTMFKSLHVKDTDTKTLHTKSSHLGGYMSEPDTLEERRPSPKKSPPSPGRESLLNRRKNSLPNSEPLKLDLDLPSEKRTVQEVYRNQPRPIELYEPGHSSLVETVDLRSHSASPPAGRESHSPVHIQREEQRRWYQQVQRGGDIPSQGLARPAPEKSPPSPVGPAPPPPPGLGETYASLHQYFDTVGRLNNKVVEDDKYFQRQFLQETHRSISPSPSPDPARQRARVKFDFKPESVKELLLKKGDLVEIIRKVNNDWFEGRVLPSGSKSGIFPVSYVQVLSGGKTSPSPKPKRELDGKVRAKFDFKAQSSSEISFKKGDVIQLLRQVDSNWYEGQLGPKSGIFPVSYVEMFVDARPAKSPSPILIKSPPPAKELSQSPISLPEEYTPYKVLYPYMPQHPDELPLSVGDTVLVVEKCDDGWYVGTSLTTNQFGTFPGNYVVPA